ncbi:MAG: hypothetical protein ACI9B9_001922, partial [Halioglobus sp.]
RESHVFRSQGNEKLVSLGFCSPNIWLQATALLRRANTLTEQH